MKKIDIELFHTKTTKNCEVYQVAALALEGPPTLRTDRLYIEKPTFAGSKEPPKRMTISLQWE